MRKKILVLTPRFPFPVIGGDKLRIYYLCKSLSDEYDLDLISLCEKKEELNYDYDSSVFKSVKRIYLPKWKSYAKSIFAFLMGKPMQVGYYSSSAFAKIVKDISNDYDIALAHLIRTGEYLKDFKGKKILEMTDAISLNYERVRKQNSKKVTFISLLYSIESLMLKKYEKSLSSKFDLVTLVSKVDSDFITTEENKHVLNVVSNGVEVNKFESVDVSHGDDIIFIGNMRTEQNIDACRYFAKDILPLVNNVLPHVKFKIIGSATDSFKKEFKNFKNVIVTGKVESISESANSAFCGVCALRLGAGIQNKVMEYMAMKIPCVTTSMGLEGIEAKPGEEVFVADSPSRFSELVIRLYKNKNLSVQIGNAGYDFVKQKHNWERILESFLLAVRSL